MGSLYLVDGSNFLFRAYHAMPPLSTKAGVPTGAVRGFVSMLLRLIGDHQPAYMAVVFDAGGRDERAELYPQYKQNRDECPADLAPQFELARRASAALGLCAINAVDAEADDVIATLARRAHQAGQKVVIVSSDKDLMQLVIEGQIELLDTMKEEGRGKLYGPREVEEKFGVPPAQLADVLALMGDSSDNLPGVPGIGPKTAAQLIQQLGSVDGLLNGLDKITVRGKDRVQALLREHRDQLLLMRRLVALKEDVPTAPPLAELQRRMPPREPLVQLLTELEFPTLLKRITQPGGLPGLPDLSVIAVPPSIAPPAPAEATNLAAISAAPAPASPAAPPTASSEKPAEPPPAAASAAPEPALFSVEALLAAPVPATTVLHTAEELTSWLSTAHAQRSSGLALSLLWCGESPKSASPRNAVLCGIGLYAPSAAPAYLPLGHRYLGAPAQLSPSEAGAQLSAFFADAAVPKFVSGAKDALLALARAGLTLAGLRSDPALCSYLLDAGEKHDLPSLVERYLPTSYPKLPGREGLGQTGKHAVPIDQVEIGAAASLAGAEARATLLLGELLRGQLDAAGRSLLDTLELPLSRVLASIEPNGILIDVGVLGALSQEAEARLKTLESEIEKAAGGVRVNLGSPKQLAELLFEKLGLEPVKKTKGKSGLSVDAEVLESLAADHPIARLILEHRSLAKLKSTYLDQLPLLRDMKTGRLHTSYQQTVAATGRLSSTEPNLQNIPIRTELGGRIRRAFVAPPGFRLIAADYSQIELRVLAHLSGDELLVHSFSTGEDVHARTAIEMFGPELGKTSEKRRAAKMINYGIIYGLTDFGLASRLGIERTTARQYIKEYFARYKGVREFMDELVVRARREGGARTLLGRFRPIPELATGNYSLRGYGERMAKNTPIQGTAADILKQAMIDVQAALEASRDARMLLTVHDELVIEARAERAEEIGQQLKAMMERAATLRVPLQVDVGIAENWADC